MIEFEDQFMGDYGVEGRAEVTKSTYRRIYVDFAWRRAVPPLLV